MKAIILAAGRGSRMGSLTSDKPKCLLEVKGRPLIEHQLHALEMAGIKDVAIVTGYQQEALQQYGSYHFHNARWANTNMVYSLSCAQEWLDTYDCIVSYADIYYEKEVVEDLMVCTHPLAVAYDPNWLEVWAKRFENPLDDAETFCIDEDSFIHEIGQKPNSIEEIQGQYMGLLKLSAQAFQFPKGYESLSFTEVLSTLKRPIKAVKNSGLWWEFDSESDVDVFHSTLASK